MPGTVPSDDDAAEQVNQGPLGSLVSNEESESTTNKYTREFQIAAEQFRTTAFLL